MSYFKFTTSKALQAWDEMEKCEEALRIQGRTFAELFGGSAVFKNDLTGVNFFGVSFSGPAYGGADLWTKPNSNSGYACWPKAKPPKGTATEHKALKDIWSEQHPKIRVDRAAFLDSVGLDWGMLFMTGCEYFRKGDSIFFSTGAKPDESACGIEILGSEFQLAKKAYAAELAKPPIQRQSHEY